MDEGTQSQPDPAEQREEWIVPVLDAVRLRPCVLIIAVAGINVVVVPPSPTGYVVPRGSMQRYHDALSAAHNVAEHKRTVLAMDRER